MQFTNLGRTGLSVSRFCLGTMNFGPTTSEPDSFAIMDRALELGINFFDTADIYGWKIGEGWTEQIIGRWLAHAAGRREKIVLATKCYNKMGEWPNERGLSAYHIKRACEGSLKRMQTDHIDLYQMHHIVPRAPVEEIFEAFTVLRQQGKVLYFGSSNFPGWQIARYQEHARDLGLFGLVSEQSLYHLAERTIELEVIPAAEHYGLGILPWSPVGQGLLSGLLSRSDHTRSQKALAALTDERRARVQRYEDFAREAGHAPADLALAWLLHQPAVTAPIVGPRTQSHLDGALRALEIELDAEQLAALDEIWPGRGAAPEAYAW